MMLLFNEIERKSNNYSFQPIFANVKSKKDEENGRKFDNQKTN